MANGVAAVLRLEDDRIVLCFRPELADDFASPARVKPSRETHPGPTGRPVLTADTAPMTRSLRERLAISEVV